MSMPPEVWEPEARARALEAIRRRLDDSTPMTARTWTVLARELGYASAYACSHAAWRLVNRLGSASHPQLALPLVRLARSLNMPSDARTIRSRLKAVDALHFPGDRDPRKPRKWRPMSDAAIRRLAKQLAAEMARTVDGDPVAPHATPGAPRLLPMPGATKQSTMGDNDAAATGSDSKGTV